MNTTSSRYDDFAATENRVFMHVRKDGKWNAENIRNADAQSPAGGVSSSVKDVAKWMRLQLNDGTFNGKQVVGSAPLAETHRPQIISHAPGNPATDRASFYGLGWNVNYDSHGRVHWNHSGGFEMPEPRSFTWCLPMLGNCCPHERFANRRAGNHRVNVLRVWDGKTDAIGPKFTSTDLKNSPSRFMGQRSTTESRRKRRPRPWPTQLIWASIKTISLDRLRSANPMARCAFASAQNKFRCRWNTSTETCFAISRSVKCPAA